MWELDHKESRELKNRCFWTVVLEKSLASALDSKEIKPVHPKGDQSWICIGRSDAEAEAPIISPPDVKGWFMGKDPDSGKDWRQDEKGMPKNDMVGWHHWLHGCEFDKLWELVQVSSVTQSCLTLCDPMKHSMQDLSVHHQLLEFTQTHVHRVSDVIQPSHPLSSPSPPVPNPSQHQSLFQWVNTSHEVAKVLSFSFSIIPSKEIPGLMPFRMDGLDLLAVQGTLKSLLQHHSSKASIFQRSAFFTVELSHPYMTTGKTIALTTWTFIGKVMFLLLNMLSRLVITFLPRSKPLLISWLQSPSAVILDPKK